MQPRNITPVLMLKYVRLICGCGYIPFLFVSAVENNSAGGGCAAEYKIYSAATATEPRVLLQILEFNNLYFYSFCQYQLNTRKCG